MIILVFINTERGISHFFYLTNNICILLILV